MKIPGPISRDYATELILRSSPSPLTLPVPFRLDHADHIIKTALDGHTKLASDHVLHPEIKGRLMETLGSLIEKAEKVLDKADLKGQADEKILEDIIITRNRVYDVLLEIVWNLTGIEKKWIGLPDEEASRGILAIMDFLKDCEKREGEELGEPVFLTSTIASQLNRMKLVNKGNSLVAWMAREIEGSLGIKRLTESYVKAIEKVVKENFYYVAYEKGLCKFGNDYALGLRWLRHLGYVQVSTNPVLAALAYEDDPHLWDSLKRHVDENLRRQYPEWFSEPDNYTDEIAMEATRFALLDNFYVFRIPFIFSNYRDGLVSYQLNPLIADDVERSVSAAMTFAQKLENDLKIYDAYLFWGYEEPREKGKPNLVIKVAAAYPSSIEIVRKINEIGIGQNITLSYTVSQEVMLGVAAMEGMAAAVKRGITPTQTYDTNMGGRLEDHLRESVASKLLLNAIEKLGGSGEGLLEEMARRLGMKEEDMKIFEERDLRGKIDLITRKRILGGSLLNEVFVEALVSIGVYGGRDQVLDMLREFEDAIKMSGTHVARRVYEIMFSPSKRPKWVEYLVRKFDIPRESAELIVARVDLLPASKRKPIDTFLTMSKRNVTNTEFPNHQLAVVREAFREDFRMEDYEDAITRELDGGLETLMTIEDFIKAYEASPELNDLLREVGINGNYGHRGIRINDWPNYGPCVKTLEEFKSAYLSFRGRVLDLVRGGRRH